jgi:hypothetical protein
MVPTHDEARAARPALGPLSTVEETIIHLARRASAAELASAAVVEAARHEIEGANGALATCRAAHDLRIREVSQLRGQLAGLKDSVADLEMYRERVAELDGRLALVVKRAEHAESIGRQHANELTQAKRERQGIAAEALFLQGALDTIRKIVGTLDTGAAVSVLGEDTGPNRFASQHAAMVLREVRETLAKAEGGPPAQG